MSAAGSRSPELKGPKEIDGEPFAEIRRFGFSKRAAGGFPHKSQRLGKSGGKQTKVVRFVRGKLHVATLSRRQPALLGFQPDDTTRVIPNLDHLPVE